MKETPEVQQYLGVPEIGVLSSKVVEGTFLHLHQNDVMFDLENYSVNIDENEKWGMS